MLRVHYTITKEQRFGKGKADDQGRQLVRRSNDLRNLSLRSTGRSYPFLRPFISCGKHQLSCNKRNPSRDLAEIPFNEDFNTGFSHSQQALSRQAWPLRSATRILNATACPSLYPLIAPFTRQSHFHLRNAELHISIATCLKIGLVNRSLPRH